MARTRMALGGSGGAYAGFTAKAEADVADTFSVAMRLGDIEPIHVGHAACSGGMWVTYGAGIREEDGHNWWYADAVFHALKACWAAVRIVSGAPLQHGAHLCAVPAQPARVAG